ncbi:GatB/YqeY domain-containing protein [Cristinia sonorae]|uniref:Altered inheritance of mitochondria protein 41 n=1 Tax=Cristinia sonorae TaxID=1940300 RepID=A0A8K0XKC4_9AGAR|nr:GatB/YqeY domain-containing protein [Cristinia sonorae]
MFARTVCRTPVLASFRSRPHQIPSIRQYAVAANEDVRAKLMEGLKTAMKAKDASKSTIIRSMLSEVYDADKKKQEKIDTPAIQALVQKAVSRRKDAAKQYESGSRPDLASQELAEASILSAYLPPLLSTSEVDRILQEVISENDIKLENPAQVNMVVGKVFRAFYARVDKTSVDSAYVRRKAEELVKGQ